MGVWIEISYTISVISLSAGHSLCGSVDWNTRFVIISANFWIVTPFVGVWIEIIRNQYLHVVVGVTPFVGVWIEIDGKWIENTADIVTPFVGVWIEIRFLRKDERHHRRHSLCGSVDWNGKKHKSKIYRKGHSLCGSVDWNYLPTIHKQYIWVTPFVGVWIEMCNYPLCRPFCFRHSLCGSVDWNR